MTFDINTALGHWPFRRVPNQTAPELRRVLEKADIEGAAVANTHGLFYKNVHDANLELADCLAPHAGFFVGVATLNPLYAAWDRDLRTCVEDLGFRALRLAPQYHGYEAGCTEAVALAKLATEVRLPLLIPHRLVDVRQHHWMDTERTIGLDEIGALCRAVPEARVIVTESAFGARALLDGSGQALYPGLFLESSRLSVHALPPAFAEEHVVFGSGAPFKHVTPALLKLGTADLAPEARQKVAGTNGRALLGM